MLHLLTLALVTPLVLTVEPTVYNVRPTSPPVTTFPARLDYTLDGAATNLLRTVQGHIKLVLLPGTHELSTDIDADQLNNAFRGSVTISGKGKAMITCKNGIVIRFIALRNLEIDGVKFSNCGSPNPVTRLLIRPLQIELIYSVVVTNCSFSIKNVKFINCDKTRLENSLFQNPVSVTASNYRSTYGEEKQRNLSVANCTFQGEFCEGLRIENLQYVNITGSFFQHECMFADEVGAFHVKKSKVSLSNVVFQDNIADYCSALLAEDSMVNISVAVFRNNRAYSKHAAICAAQSNFHITNTIITNNSILTAGKGAGGLFSALSNISMKSVVLSSNTGYNGGAVNLRKSKLVTSNVVFNSNTATHSGGAVYAESSSALFDKTHFRFNSDQLGKAIVADAESRMLKPGGECSESGNEFQCRLSKVQSYTLSGECNSFLREKLNEGYRRCMYRDSLNIPTIGIGFNLMRSGARRDIASVGANYDKLLARTRCLSDYQIRQLFNRDMARAVSCAQRFVGSNWYRLGVTRQSAVADMAFNLGCPRLSKFRRFRAALQSTPPNYRAAVREMRDSHWCRQVGYRCGRNVACMR